MHLLIAQFLFCSHETKQKTSYPVGEVDTTAKSSSLEVYYTRSRIDRLVLCVITGMILLLLVVPVYVLYHLVTELGNNRINTICIGVLVVFTLVFSAVLSLFTSAKRHEILGAAAAYCAVLVVFLGNTNNQSNNNG